MFSHHFSRPRWLFFDLDDTLWDFKRNSLLSLSHVHEIFPEIHLRFPSFDVFRDVYHTHNARLWKDFEEGKISSDTLRPERWRLTVFPESTPEESIKICRDIDSEYLRFLASRPFAVEGAHDILKSLSADFMIGVLSNGFPETQYCKLQTSGLWRYIIRMVVSDETGARKPEPEIFRYALEETGASGIPIMIGDNPATDILGALRAGWDAIWYNPGGETFPYSEKELLKEGINPGHFLGAAKTLDRVEEIIRRS